MNADVYKVSQFQNDEYLSDDGQLFRSFTEAKKAADKLNAKRNCFGLKVGVNFRVLKLSGYWESIE